MNFLFEHLDKILIAAAIGQILIAGINMRLDKLLNWTDELGGLSRLLYEVFYVHKWFISVTCLMFGVLTIRFASDMATGAYEMARWLAAAIGIFWGIRTAIQWCFYSSEHWKGKTKETVIHWIFTVAYGGCTFFYLLAAFSNQEG